MSTSLLKSLTNRFRRVRIPLEELQTSCDRPDDYGLCGPFLCNALQPCHQPVATPLLGTLYR